MQIKVKADPYEFQICVINAPAIQNTWKKKAASGLNT